MSVNMQRLWNFLKLVLEKLDKIYGMNLYSENKKESFNYGLCCSCLLNNIIIFVLNKWRGFEWFNLTYGINLF